MVFRKQLHALVWMFRHMLGKLEVSEWSVIKEFLSRDSICLDLGAHGGSWSRALARYVTKGHVYAFEALPYYADVLTMTMKVVGPRNLTIINCAVAEKDGVVQIARKDSEGNILTGQTHVASVSENFEHSVSVAAVSLDSFWKESGEKQIDFIKCDVEGFELFVLKGALRLIENCRPVFYNELNTEWCQRYDYLPEDIFQMFEEFDYSPFYIKFNEGLVPVIKKKHTNRDVLFVPNENSVPNNLLVQNP